MTGKLKPIFEKRIFCDVNFEHPDYDEKASFVIEHILERGNIEDIRQCRRYYGDEKISTVLLKAKYLPRRRLYLASAVINQPIQPFRCYILQQSIPTLFPY